MWKNKLEETSELSFATLQNKDAAWEKLQNRLEEKPKKKIAVWYWVAAACIVIIASIPFIITHKTNDVVQSTNNIKQQEKSSIKEDKAEQNIIDETATIHQPKKEKQQEHFVEQEIKKQVITDTSKQIDVANDNVATNEPTAIKTLPVITTDTNTIAATSTIKKKLKVVHINELGEPVEITESTSPNTDLHLFQLKLAQQEIYNASSTAASSNNSSIFRTKKPSN